MRKGLNNSAKHSCHIFFCFFRFNIIKAYFKKEKVPKRAHVTRSPFRRSNPFLLISSSFDEANNHHFEYQTFSKKRVLFKSRKKEEQPFPERSGCSQFYPYSIIVIFLTAELPSVASS
jgi:hypothetical protein